MRRSACSFALVLAALVAAVPAGALPTLPGPTARDVEAKGKLFQRGIPVSGESFSPDGFHFAHLHFLPGGFLRRKPRRCAFVLDLGSGESRAIPTREGTAARLGGWDPTGRYLLVEATQPDLFSAITGSWTTYQWVYDVIASEYVSRRPFTGTRDGRRFRWNAREVYHGAWNGERDAKVWPLFEGELARMYQAREEEMAEEDERRLAIAARLGVGDGEVPRKTLDDVLDRLDARWTQRGQRDPVVSDLFGDRPALVLLRDGAWVRVQTETEHVAVLDRGLVLLTGQGGRQAILHVDRGEILPLPPPPPGFVEILENRWDRAGGFYDENDPLPRDLQYRRSWDSSQGMASYYNYITPNGMHALLLYPFGTERRVLRIVDLPRAWRTPPPPTTSEAPAPAPASVSPTSSSVADVRPSAG